MDFQESLWFCKKEALSIVLTDGVHTKRMLFGKKSWNKVYSKFLLKAFVSCLL